jgi:hypothetical protein
MSDPESRRDAVEEFLARYRRDERPPVSEYADRHPEFAGEIRELFPLLQIEEAGAPTR